MKRLSLALAALLAVGGAQAATVQFQYGLPLTLATTEITQTGSLGLFNTNLGTLTGAVLTVFGGASFSFTGTNGAAGPEIADITSSTSLRWSSSLAALTPFLTNAINLSFSSGDQSYAVGQTRSFGPSAQNGNAVDDVISIGAALSQAGGGTFSLTCRSLSGLSVLGGGGNISTTQATQAGCGARIVYTYTEPVVPPPVVPEPASLALVGLALAAGAGVTARRRRQA